MKYKRLTIRNSDGSVSQPTHSTFEKVFNRLAELEDKMENGTLIELGYHIRKSYRNHDDQRYKIVVVEENEIDKIGYDGLTREEAEAKLKELQNG